MDITSFLIYCFIVTYTPGPTNVLILSTVQHFGAKKALIFGIGGISGLGMLLGLSAFLNSVLVALVPKILGIMQVIGCIYMLYLAYKIYHMNTSKGSEKQIATFGTGFLMQFVNPKALLFTMTVLPSFVMPYYTSSWMLALFAVVILVIGFTACITWVVSGTVFKSFLQKYQKASNTVMAMFLVYSAIMVSGIVELIRAR